jgi:hypothetical protein
VVRISAKRGIQEVADVSLTGVPPPFTTSPGATPNGAGEGIEAVREAIREQYFGGARLLFADARVVYLLLNDARSRVIARVFGISGQNSALVTVIALGVAAEAAHRKVVRVLNAPGTPDAADTVIGASVLRESVRAIIGTSETPFFGTLVIASVAGSMLRPVLRATVRGVKASAHLTRADFGRRYGHIIRPSHRQPWRRG